MYNFLCKSQKCLHDHEKDVKKNRILPTTRGFLGGFVSTHTYVNTYQILLQLLTLVNIYNSAHNCATPCYI